MTVFFPFFTEPRRRRTLFVAALALAALHCVEPAQTAPAAPPTITRVGLTAADYEQASSAYAKQGLRPVSISGYLDNGAVRYVGLWRKVSGPSQFARAGMTQADYDKEGVARGKDGWTLVSASPFGIGGETRFNAIWEKRPSPLLFSRYGMTEADYQAWSNERTKAGMHLTQIAGYTINGKARYGAIFEGGAAPVGTTHLAMSSADLNSQIVAYSKQGYRLKQVSGYQDAGQDRFAATWEKPAGGLLHVRWGVGLADLQRAGDVERLSGWSPFAFQGYTTGSAPRFTMLLETPFRARDLDAIAKAVNDALTAQKVAGASVAIAKDRKLLYAGGFGKANVETGVPMDVRHRLRIGSVSKMITSAAVYKLVEDGLLTSVDRKVFGTGGILDNEIKVPASWKDLEGASIRLFIQHISGLPSAVGDPNNCNAGGANGNATLTARIQDSLAQAAKTAKVGKPGDANAYSNMSHIIAEAVIEKLSGRSYLDYVRTRVLAPAGLATSGPLAPALFTPGDYKPASGEAKHYSANGTYASYPSSTCETKPPGTGAGGWAMSAVDLLRWFTSIDRRSGRVPDVLNATDQIALTTAGSPKTPPGVPYAGGIFVKGAWTWCGDSAKIWMGHNGGVAGASSELWLLRDGNFAIAVIVNQESTCAGGGSNGGAAAIFKNLRDVVKTVDWPNADQF